jgi:hypothetical protein
VVQPPDLDDGAGHATRAPAWTGWPAGSSPTSSRASSDDLLAAVRHGLRGDAGADVPAGRSSGFICAASWHWPSSAPCTTSTCGGRHPVQPCGGRWADRPVRQKPADHHRLRCLRRPGSHPDAEPFFAIAGGTAGWACSAFTCAARSDWSGGI